MTVRTVSTLSPPTELLTLHRYFPESSTLASLMMSVPLTCNTFQDREVVEFNSFLFFSFFFNGISFSPGGRGRRASPVVWPSILPRTCTTCQRKKEKLKGHTVERNRGSSTSYVDDGHSSRRRRSRQQFLNVLLVRFKKKET